MPYELAVQEQFLLELVNAHRIEAGAPPLAWAEPLADAAREQARGLTTVGVLTHTGADGSTPVARMRRAGFSFTGRWAGAENVAWASASSPESRTHDVRKLDKAFKGSEKHLRNRLDPRFTRFGAGFRLGAMAEEPHALLVAETYAFSGSEQALTGAAFVDRDGDDRFEPGEELGGVIVEARRPDQAQPVRAVSRPSGGYDLPLAPGDWVVSARNQDGAELASVRVTVTEANVKIDLIGREADEPRTLGDVRARADVFALKVRYPRATAVGGVEPTPLVAAPGQAEATERARDLADSPPPFASWIPHAPREYEVDEAARTYLFSTTIPIAAIRSTFL